MSGKAQRAEIPRAEAHSAQSEPRPVGAPRDLTWLVIGQSTAGEDRQQRHARRADKEQIKGTGPFNTQVDNGPVPFSPQPFSLPRARKYLRRNWLRKSLQAILKDAGLPMVKYHALRHTCASLLLQQNTHAKVVQERLGHSTIGITLDTYSHVAPSMQKAAADTMQGLLKPTGS